MASKRAREEDGEAHEHKHKHKKVRKGFSVGPQNLPQGTYRRKVDKIKKNLIHKAKLKKDFAKVKARQGDGDRRLQPTTASEDSGHAEKAPSATLEVHPDRLACFEQPEAFTTSAARAQKDVQDNNPNASHPDFSKHRQHQRRPKVNPYSRASKEGQSRKEEAERRQRERERIEQERRHKAEQRDRHRRVMADARRGKDGKRSLATESEVLLEKVKKLMGAERSSGVVDFGKKNKSEEADRV